MKKRIIIGNWKTNKTQAEVQAFFAEVNPVLAQKKHANWCGVAPVFIHLPLVLSLAKEQMVTVAQDANFISTGAYTGTVSYSQLKDLGVNTVIIGHSERREYYHETDAIVNRKINALLTNGMTPILCIGETNSQFEANATDSVCASQLEKAIHGVDERYLDQLIIAYEPIWAIGTGKTATAEIAETTIKKIRLHLSKLTNDALAKKIPILYGGSVKPNNIESLMAQPNIDGALVGGASLSAQDFLSLLGDK